MNDKELLELTIKQWEYVLDIMKKGITYNIIEAKSMALIKMGGINNLTHLCFLCYYHYDRINCVCRGCPMEGYWPHKSRGLFSIGKKKTTKYCFEHDSLYSGMEFNASKKNIKSVKRILKAMKKRLKMYR